MVATPAHLLVRNKSTETIVVRSTGFSPFPMPLPEQRVAAQSEMEIKGEVNFDIWWYNVDVYSQDGRKLAEKSLVCENSALVFLDMADHEYVLE